MQRGNINANLPDASTEEMIELLSTFRGGNVRVERILSEGQATPEGYWYDQPWDEWVLVMNGEAELVFDAPAGVERLYSGDWLLIPAHRRHRVSLTAPATLWLAIHADTP